MTRTEAIAHVDVGAAFLDKKRPGWFNKIDLDVLAMYDGCYCVLGQLDGSFEVGCDNLGITSISADDLMFTKLPKGIVSAMKAGFTIAPYDYNRQASWQYLQDAWVEAIVARKAAEVPEPEPELQLV